MMKLKKGEDDSHYTVLLPFVTGSIRTKWHPTDSTGPFKVLSRGAFKSPELARAWAEKNVPGSPYRVVRYDSYYGYAHVRSAARSGKVEKAGAAGFGGYHSQFKGYGKK